MVAKRLDAELHYPKLSYTSLMRILNYAKLSWTLAFSAMNYHNNGHDNADCYYNGY